LCVLIAPAPFLTAPAAAQAPSSRVDGRGALQEAARLVRQGQLEEAERQARRALADPGTEAAAWSVLGTINFQQQRVDDSIACLKKAIQLDAHLLGAHLSLAEIYLRQGNAAAAEPLFERVLTLDPSNLAARLAIARRKAEQGHYQRSVDAAAPALAAFKQSPEGLYILATDLFGLGDRPAATALAAHWTRLDHVPEQAAIAFGVLFASHGAGKEAVEILEHARAKGGTSYELAFNLAGAHLVAGDLVRALDTYDAALAARPDSVPALTQAARIAERQGDLERSLSYWIRAKKIDPDTPEILLGFGRVCLRMDLLDDAEPALARAAALKPGDSTYQYTLAAAKVGKKQFEAARQLLEPLVAAQPADPQLQYALGSIFYLEGQLQEAASHLRESLRLQPDQLAAQYYLGLVLRDEGDDPGAIAMLERLLDKYPDHAASSEALGGLLMSAQRYDEAERRLRQAIQLNPGLVKANYQLGLLLARMGRKDEADRQLALARSLREEDEATSRLQLRLLDPGP
jgi:tetratricopeptide (TPR) repeat protein